jgi:hypothetical protein
MHRAFLSASDFAATTNHQGCLGIMEKMRGRDGFWGVKVKIMMLDQVYSGLICVAAWCGWVGLLWCWVRWKVHGWDGVGWVR